MMLANVLVPFLLAIDTNVSNVSNFDMEYSYNVSKIIIKYKEPFEVTELTSTIKCQPVLLKSLRCFMYDIMSETTVKYSYLGVADVKKDFMKVGEWFQMWFNNRGLLKTFIQSDDEKIKSFINHISQQFSLGIDLADHKLYIGVLSEFTAYEKTPVGVCKTMYYIDVDYIKKNASKETNSFFQIRLLTMLKYYSNTENLVRVYIMKYRTNCDYSTVSDDMNKTMKVTNYGHEMKVEANQFSILTTMDVHLPPDPKHYRGSSENSLQFSVTTRLNLIDINSRNPILYNDTYDSFIVT